jgi:RND family efflux transporter MFP subunit
VALAVAVLFSAVALVAFTLLRHHREAKEAQARRAAAGKGPTVAVVKVETTAGRRDVTLPADVRAFNQATLYAKATGFLQSISVERGDRVRMDEVLAVIQSPETDQLVSAAAADLVVKRRDLRRAQDLTPKGVMTVQELDQARGAYEVSVANLKRLQALQQYQQVLAPFDGVVTNRYLDVGALVQNGVAVVDMADMGLLRVSVFVGQDAATFVHTNDPVTLRQDEKPDAPIEAAVSRISEALDPRSRTMQCEIWIDNTHWGLFPGTFLHATLHLNVPPLPTVPDEAVFFRNDKLVVAVIEGNRAHLRPIQPGLDDGKTMQIRSGLRAGETVALSFPNDLDDGAVVQPVERSREQNASR